MCVRVCVLVSTATCVYSTASDGLCNALALLAKCHNSPHTVYVDKHSPMTTPYPAPQEGILCMYIIV